MTPPSPPSPETILLAVAAPAEASAVLAGLGADPALADIPWTLHRLSERIHLVVTGVGKVNAGAGVARTLDQSRHAAVVSLGVAGALPGSGVHLGQAVAATASVYADEGLQTEDGRFLDCSALGFPVGPFSGSSIQVREPLLARFRMLADVSGLIATVSTCSGSDALARQVRARTGALAEAMEGAAVAHVAARLGVPAAEFRVISNTTGDRAAQEWDLIGALERLRGAAGRLG